MACSAARNDASGPFWFTAPRPTTHLPSPGLSTSAASNGGDDHSLGSACFTSYMKYSPTVFGAPASSVANTPGCPLDGTFATCWNPASRSIFISSSQPSFMPRFSAAIEGCRIQVCSRCTFSSCCRWIASTIPFNSGFTSCPKPKEGVVMAPAATVIAAVETKSRRFIARENIMRTSQVFPTCMHRVNLTHAQGPQANLLRPPVLRRQESPQEIREHKKLRPREASSQSQRFRHDRLRNSATLVVVMARNATTKPPFVLSHAELPAPYSTLHKTHACGGSLTVS